MEIARLALISLAETCNDLKAFPHAIDYYKQLYTVELRLSRSQSDLAETNLNIALTMIGCDEYSFDEKKEAFLKVNMPKTDRRYVSYLLIYIT